jgi:hypothetical protein
MERLQAAEHAFMPPVGENRIHRARFCMVGVALDATGRSAARSVKR